MKKFLAIMIFLTGILSARLAIADQQQILTLIGIWGEASLYMYAVQTGGDQVSTLPMAGRKFNGQQQTYVAGGVWLDVQRGAVADEAWELRVFISVGTESKMFNTIDDTKSIDLTYRFTGTDASISTDGTANIPDGEWPYPSVQENRYSWLWAVDDPAIDKSANLPAWIMSSAENYTGRQRLIFGVRIPHDLNQSGFYSATVIFDLDIQ